MMVRRISIGLALLLALSVGCDKSAKPASGDAKAGGEEAPAAKKKPEAQVPEIKNPKLLEPFDATEQAPELYKVKLETTKGDVLLEIHRDWAPRGADRFYNLVKLGFFEEVAFFRVVDGFMVQFGLHGNPDVAKAWKTAPIKDDERTQDNKRGTISFANRGPDTRTTQVFINYNDHASLDDMNFAPFGKVIEGMEVVDSLYEEYGDGPPAGSGPNQGKIERTGNPYLKRNFPKLDYLKSASIVE